MKAIVLGCSHAAGSEMEQEPGRDCKDFVFGYRNSFPVLVAQALGYEPQNYAIPGGSNDAIFRVFNQELHRITANDIVIVCWTGPNRTEVWHELDQHWLPFALGQHDFHPIRPYPYALSGKLVGGTISLNKEYQQYRQQWERYHCNLQANELNKLKNIQALNAMASSRKIPVMNIDTFHPISGTENIVWAVQSVFCDWAQATNQPRTSRGHYFLPTHQQFAEQILATYRHAV